MRPWLLAWLLCLACTDGTIITQAEEAPPPPPPPIEPCKPEPETCNGKDDDCDGVIDEGLESGFCYHAELATARHSPCRPGLIRCEEGTWFCDGEVLPEPERCDGVDNDCNGIPDDLAESPWEPVDVVLIIDRSGSAIDENRQLSILLPPMLMSLALAGHSVWLFDLPALDGDLFGPAPECPQTLPHAECTMQAANIARRLDLGQYGADEHSYAVLLALARRGLSINWTWGSRRVAVAFFDEPDRSVPEISKRDIVRAFQQAPFPYDVIIYTNRLAGSDYDGMGFTVEMFRSIDIAWLTRRIIEPACGG